MENSTVAGNRAHGADGVGGGIYSAGSTLGMRYSTVTGNVARHGGGLALRHAGGTLLGSIVTGNHAPPGGAEQDCVAHGGPGHPPLAGRQPARTAWLCHRATSRSDRSPGTHA